MRSYLSRILSAFRSILFFSAAVRLPFFFCCEARAFALRACDLSGIGYLRSSGSPNSDLGSEFRFLVLSSAMMLLPVSEVRDPSIETMEWHPPRNRAPNSIGLDTGRGLSRPRNAAGF
jgi:hypothetical protein